MEKPILLCGLGRMGWPVLEYLTAAGLPVVAIDLVDRSGDARLAGVRFVHGDCRRREVLERAGVVGARGVLILTSDDLVNISTALMVRGLDPEVRVVVRMFNQNLITRLGKAVHNVYALSTSILTAPLLALTALTGQALGAFRLDDGPDGRRQVAEVVGRPRVAAAAADRRRGRPAPRRRWCVAHVPAGDGAAFSARRGPRGAPGRRRPPGRLRRAARPGRPARPTPTASRTRAVRWANPLRRLPRRPAHAVRGRSGR